MIIDIIEKGVKYSLYVPLADIRKAVSMAGWGVIRTAQRITPEEQQEVNLLRIERREWIRERTFLKAWRGGSHENHNTDGTS